MWVNVTNMQIVSRVPELNDFYQRKLAYYAGNPSLLEEISIR